MPPRQGQLDEISEAIGELKGSVKAIEKYVHEHRHEVNNASQKIDALGTKITRDMAAVEARLETKLDAFKLATEARLTALERAEDQQIGARKLAAWFVQSPLIAWIAAAAVMLAAWWKGGK